MEDTERDKSDSEFREVSSQDGNVRLTTKMEDELADLLGDDSHSVLTKRRSPMSSQEDTTSTIKPFLSRKKVKSPPIPAKPAAKKKSSTISLDQLLMEKNKSDKQDPIKQFEALMSEQNAKKQSIVKDDDLHTLELERLKTILSTNKVDIMMTYDPYQVCLKSMKIQLPKPYDISSVIAKQTDQNNPFTQLFKKETYTSLKIFIQNGLDCIIENYGINNLPKYMINILLSYVYFEKDEMTVYKAYTILAHVFSKLKEGNTNAQSDSNINLLLTFKDFVNVFGIYDIQTNQAFKATSTTPSDTTTTAPQLQAASQFPFLNLYYVLNLLQETVNENIFTFDETKHLILFVIMLMLDPNYIRTKQGNDDQSSNKLKSIIFKTVLLLEPLLQSLLESFFSFIAKESKEAINQHVFTLFGDIWSSIDESVRFTLCTKVSYVLPPVPIHGVDLQRRFALFSISNILKLNNIESILVQPSIVEELVKILKPFIAQIKDETIEILMMLNMVALTDICCNDRKELNQQKRDDRNYPFEKLIRTWASKIKEPKDFDFNKTRIKDGLILIQSKLASLILDQSSSSIMDFFKPSSAGDTQPINTIVYEQTEEQE